MMVVFLPFPDFSPQLNFKSLNRQPESGFRALAQKTMAYLLHKRVARYL
jgi:hypothetical protein